MNGSVIFMAKGTKLHHRIKGTNLVIIYVSPEVSCVIPNKASYMNDETWSKSEKVVTPGVIKMEVSNVACVFYYFILYISNCPYLYLQILFRRFLISQSGGHSSHMMTSSLA